MSRRIIFTWNHTTVESLLGQLRFSEGMLLGRIAYVGFLTEAEAALTNLTQEVVASASIEGTRLDTEAVRNTFCHFLHIDDPAQVREEQNATSSAAPKRASSTELPEVQGAVQVLLDATHRFDKPVDHTRLMDWHKMFFPSGYAGARRIMPGRYRSDRLNKSTHDDIFFNMNELLDWVNDDSETDPLIKAAIAHLGFLIIRPFGGGDGRVVRAMTELLLTRADVWSTQFTRRASGEEEPNMGILASNAVLENEADTARSTLAKTVHIPQRFYSMSRFILAERDSYRQAVTLAREAVHSATPQHNQPAHADITGWLMWFLQAELRSIELAASATHALIGEAHGQDEFWRGVEAVPLNSRQCRMLADLRKKIRIADDPTTANTITNSMWAQACNISADTALRDITYLVDKGLLIREPFGGRSTRYRLVERLFQED